MELFSKEAETPDAVQFRRAVAYGRAMRQLQDSEGWQLVMQALTRYRAEAQKNFDQCYSSDGNVIRAMKLEVMQFDRVIGLLHKFVQDGIDAAASAIDAVQTTIKESDDNE